MPPILFNQKGETLTSILVSLFIFTVISCSSASLIISAARAEYKNIAGATADTIIYQAEQSLMSKSFNSINSMANAPVGGYTGYSQSIDVANISSGIKKITITVNYTVPGIPDMSRTAIFYRTIDQPL